MFSIRQALRLGARLARARYSAHRCCAPIMHKPDGIVALRLVHEDAGERKSLGELEGKMKLIFTCKKCRTRNSKLISKLAYNKGVVIVKCDGCKNNHLIADNLGWFPDIHNGINIERLMAAKGESVRKIMNDTEGYMEAVVNEEFNSRRKNSSATRDSDDGGDCRAKTEKIEVSKES